MNRNYLHALLPPLAFFLGLVLLAFSVLTIHILLYGSGVSHDALNLLLVIGILTVMYSLPLSLSVILPTPLRPRLLHHVMTNTRWQFALSIIFLIFWFCVAVDATVTPLFQFDCRPNLAHYAQLIEAYERESPMTAGILRMAHGFCIGLVSSAAVGWAGIGVWTAILWRAYRAHKRTELERRVAAEARARNRRSLPDGDAVSGERRSRDSRRSVSNDIGLAERGQTPQSERIDAVDDLAEDPMEGTSQSRGP
ncbi:uncharacterized protein VTP21DRAFT_9538 [Calcarisporiella thermophila]|uniref:uncharacterized protein n=1 Tax=Calcarisporiella thermophila TaxID=911321 RepID=UPI00374461D8